MKRLFIMAIFVMIAATVFVSCEKEDSLQEDSRIVKKEYVIPAAPSSALKSVSSFPYVFDGEIDGEVSTLYSTTVSYDGTVTNTADGTGSAKFIKNGSGIIILHMGPQPFNVDDGIDWEFAIKSNLNAGTSLFISKEGGAVGIYLASSVNVYTSWVTLSVDVSDEIEQLINDEGWSYSDNWTLELIPTGYHTYYIDDIDLDATTETPTITGPRFVFGITPAEFCAGDEYDEYLWTISGNGTLTGSSPYNSHCEYAGSTTGNFILNLQVRNSGADWSEAAAKYVVRR